MGEKWVHVQFYMSVDILRCTRTQYSVREWTPVMVSRLAPCRPAFWKWEKNVRALKFGSRNKVRNRNRRQEFNRTQKEMIDQRIRLNSDVTIRDDHGFFYLWTNLKSDFRIQLRFRWETMTRKIIAKDYKVIWRLYLMHNWIN